MKDAPLELEDLVADMMRKHGPDRHIDGHEKIAQAVWEWFQAPGPAKPSQSPSPVPSDAADDGISFDGIRFWIEDEGIRIKDANGVRQLNHTEGESLSRWFYAWYLKKRPYPAPVADGVRAPVPPPAIPADQDGWMELHPEPEDGPDWPEWAIKRIDHLSEWVAHLKRTLRLVAAPVPPPKGEEGLAPVSKEAERLVNAFEAASGALGSPSRDIGDMEKKGEDYLASRSALLRAIGGCAARLIPWMQPKPDCELCKGSGFYGDNGPGRKGNSEYIQCDCTQSALEPTPRDTKGAT